MDDGNHLEQEFHKDMLWILDHEAEAGLNSSRFRQMIEQHGGVRTAHLLLEPNRQLPANTFSYLRKLNRLNLTMESYVVEDKYRDLFSDQER